MTLERRARRFAARAHLSIGQKRKYTGLPYITHSAAVVRLLRMVPHTEEMLAAAWVYDTVDDAVVTLERIKEEFGAEVAQLVHELTGVRPASTTVDPQPIAAARPAAKTIKLADLIHEARSVLQHAPEFAAVYMKTKTKLLEALEGGDPALFDMAKEVVNIWRHGEKIA